MASESHLTEELENQIISNTLMLQKKKLTGPAEGHRAGPDLRPLDSVAM